MLILLSLLAIAYGSEVFVQDVIFSVLGTIIDGAEFSRRRGNEHYTLYLLWQTKDSTINECTYCHYEIQDKEMIRKYTDDDLKIDYSTDPFIFPTEYNSNIPPYEINKEVILVHILKELVDLFSGVDVSMNGNSCCYIYSLYWN